MVIYGRIRLRDLGGSNRIIQSRLQVYANDCMLEPLISETRTDDNDLNPRRIIFEHADRLHRYVSKRIPSRYQSVISTDDILQDVWLAAFQDIKSFQPDGPRAMERWLTRIAQRKLINALRFARAKKRDGTRRSVVAHLHSSYLDLFATIAAAQRTPSSEDAAREAIYAVKSGLNTLPETYRTAVKLYYIDHRSRAEIALSMGLSDSAVNSLLYRGLQKLRGELGHAGNYFSSFDLPAAPPIREQSS